MLFIMEWFLSAMLSLQQVSFQPPFVTAKETQGLMLSLQL